MRPGGDPLTAQSLLDFAFFGADADQFELLTPLGVILASQSKTLQIAFTPNTDGDFTDAKFQLITDLNADFGVHGMILNWNLTGAAANIPAPSMLCGVKLMLCCMRSRCTK